MEILPQAAERIAVRNSLAFMSIFKFTRDKTVKRLRWVMVCTIIFDKLNTLLCQPRSYWHFPKTAVEGNPFIRLFLSRGLTVYVIYSMIYILVAFSLASTIPKRLALVGIFAVILGHYWAASTWLVFYWNFGSCAAGIYAIVLGVVFVQLAFCN
jgi:hypothetical protein